MLDSILDDITLDDLASLRTELNDFFQAHDSYEWAFYESNPDCEEIDRSAAAKAEAVKKRIRDLAIDWGIHRDFLREYVDFSRDSALKAKAALQQSEDLIPF